jgi:hypothetical protein
MLNSFQLKRPARLCLAHRRHQGTELLSASDIGRAASSHKCICGKPSSLTLVASVTPWLRETENALRHATRVRRFLTCSSTEIPCCRASEGDASRDVWAPPTGLRQKSRPQGSDAAWYLMHNPGYSDVMPAAVLSLRPAFLQGIPWASTPRSGPAR